MMTSPIAEMHRDILVITGRGRRSAGGRPVLQKSMRQFLSRVSGPSISEVSGNDGRFLLKRVDIDDWIKRVTEETGGIA